FECQEKDGMHLMEDMFIIEVADVDTDAILPDGEKGNLVITSLYRHHPPLIRYNLRDYIRIVSDGQRRCGCGSYTRRMDHFLGRLPKAGVRGVVGRSAAGRAVRSRCVLPARAARGAVLFLLLAGVGRACPRRADAEWKGWLRDCERVPLSSDSTGRGLRGRGR